MLELLIVIPCYNHGPYLKELIDSIRSSKTTCQYSVCIVDDGSTDGSWQVIDQLQQTVAGVVGLRLATNRKTSAARNTGIASTPSKFVLCVDADDRIPPDYVHKLWRTLKYTPADVAYADSQFFGGFNGRSRFPEFDIDLLRQRNYVNAGAMFRRQVWETVGGFDEEMVLGYEDWDFWLRTARAGFTFKKCSNTEYLYRISTGPSRNTEASARMAEVYGYLVSKHGEWLTRRSSEARLAIQEPSR